MGIVEQNAENGLLVTCYEVFGGDPFAATNDNQDSLPTPHSWLRFPEQDTKPFFSAPHYAAAYATALFFGANSGAVAA
jgi:hypothetical protein